MTTATAEWAPTSTAVPAAERYDLLSVPKTDDSDIGALLALAGNGDAQAWNRIVERYTNLLWSVGRAHRLDTVSIHDVIQTTWLRLLENLPRIREPERLAGWLVTTARRECLAELRRAGRDGVGWNDDEVIAIADKAPALDQLLLTSERDAALWQCFSTLSERCQALLRVLMATEKSSYAEISEAMGLPIGSIGPTRLRCLRLLRESAANSGYPFDGAGAAAR